VDFDLTARTGPGGLPAIVDIEGSSRFRSEHLLAYELGYRVQVSEHVSLDVASYYNNYNRLQSSEPGMPFLEINPPPPHLIIPLAFANGYRGHTYGVELAANWRATSHWRLSSGYTFLHEVLLRNPASNDTGTAGTATNNPRNQFQIHSTLGSFHGLELDSALYVVGKVPNQFTPLYSRFDTQLAWQATRSLEFSIVVQNAFKSGHLEFGSTPLGQQATLIPRSAYGEIRWHF
jgi:iron complex outermembrane receptor protein